MKKNFLLLVSLFGVHITSDAQREEQALKIGDTIPAAVWVKIPGAAGAELIILDFWNTWCGACISAFPKLQLLKKQFCGDINIVLINKEEDDEEIEKRFLKLNKSRGNGHLIQIPSEFPTINADSFFSGIFPHEGVPHYVWINKEKKVIAITGSQSITLRNVEAALFEQKIELDFKDDLVRKAIRDSGIMRSMSPLLKPASYSAILNSVPYIADNGRRSRVDSINQVFKMNLFGYSSVQLFNFAYEGRNKWIINEIDSSIFWKPPKVGMDRNEWIKKYCFNYELQIPVTIKEKWKEIMFEDLNRYLPSLVGIVGEIEHRKYHCFVLRIKDSTIVSNSRKVHQEDDKDIYEGTYYVELIRHLEKLLISDTRSILVDETGRIGSSKVFFRLPNKVQNPLMLKEKLALYNFILIEEEREVEVLVIKKTKP